MQLSLFAEEANPPTITLPEFDRVDHWILAFSGGKDSIASLIWLLENVDQSKIELWHHLIDDQEQFMDWNCTKGYSRISHKQ